MFKLPNFRNDQYLILAVVLVMLIFSPTVPVTAQPEPSRQQLVLGEIAPVPVSEASELDKTILAASLSAKAIYVSDEQSGSVLLSKNPNQQLYPASTTKIMTALVVREVYPLTQVLTVGEGAFSDGNVMGLLPGEQISVNQLLHGLLISSGNDAAYVLANNHPEGYDGFVRDMNQKASDLRLKQSYFSNPSGLDGEGLAMSAHDLAILSREIFKDQILLEIMGSPYAQATDASALYSHPLGHTHQLLYTDPTVIAGKTGTTEGAGQVLVTLFERADQSGQNRKVLVVVMGSEDRYADTQAIINWIFENYYWQQISLHD